MDIDEIQNMVNTRKQNAGGNRGGIPREGTVQHKILSMLAKVDSKAPNLVINLPTLTDLISKDSEDTFKKQSKKAVEKGEEKELIWRAVNSEGQIFRPQHIRQEVINLANSGYLKGVGQGNYNVHLSEKGIEYAQNFGFEFTAIDITPEVEGEPPQE